MDDTNIKTETIEQAKARMQAAGVHTIIAQFVDIHGSPKGKYIPLAHLDDILVTGAGFAGPSIWGTGLPRNGPRAEFYGEGGFEYAASIAMDARLRAHGMQWHGRWKAFYRLLTSYFIKVNRALKYAWLDTQCRHRA